MNRGQGAPRRLWALQEVTRDNAHLDLILRPPITYYRGDLDVQA